MSNKMDNKKIVIISPVAMVLGGAVRSMCQLAINLQRHNYDVSVIVPSDGSLIHELERYGIGSKVIPFDWWLRGASDASSFDKSAELNAMATLSMVEYLRDEKPFVCISYTIDMPWLAYAAHICGIAHICQVCESIDDTSIWQTRLSVAETLQTINKLSVAIFANSLYTKQSIEKYIKPEKSVEVVYPYVDKKKTEEMSKDARPTLFDTKKKAITLVGSIMPAKGQEDAIRALHILVQRKLDANLYLVGPEVDETYAQRLREIVKSKGLEGNVFFVGEVPNPHVYTRNSDVAIVCSRNEPFGRVTVEAMIVGTPVVGADSAGTAETLSKQDGIGLLYGVGNYSELADKIEVLLRDKKSTEKIIARAKKFVNSTFSLDKNQAPMLECIEDIHTTSNSQIFLPDLTNTLHLLSRKMNAMSTEIEIHKNRITTLHDDIHTLHQEIEKIVNSASYRVGRLIALPIRKVRQVMKK